ncbi:MAG: hypothetical protein H7Y32_17265 [Chloroflexales bacterium]|nr:hypothetical protein [Chloroflexales bacterium]
MLGTIGFAAAPDQQLWREALYACQPDKIIDTPYGNTPPHSPVSVWLLVPPRAADLASLAALLRLYSAPLVVITTQLKPLVRKARSIPALAFLCHPIRAELALWDVLFLAGQRTGGVRVLEAPKGLVITRGDARPRRR